MNQQVLAVTQMFLIPASILLTAVAMARTPALRALISAVGLALCVIWLIRMTQMRGIPVTDRDTGVALSVVFLIATAISTAMHLWQWRRECQIYGFLPSWINPPPAEPPR